MDLHLIPGAVASSAETAAIDALIGPPETGWDGGARRMESEGHVALGGHDARGRRHLLLPALQAVQGRIGWISPGALNYICRRLTVPPADAYGVATFYSLLSVEPRPATVVHVCDDIACRVRGAEDLVTDVEKHFGPAGTTSANGGATWQRSPCLGLCERAPAALVQRAGAATNEPPLLDADARRKPNKQKDSTPSRSKIVGSLMPGADAQHSAPGPGGSPPNGPACFDLVIAPADSAAVLTELRSAPLAGVAASHLGKGTTDGGGGARSGSKSDADPRTNPNSKRSTVASAARASELIRTSTPRTGSFSAPQTLGAGADDLRLLRRVGRVDPESLDEYRAHGGYAALRRAFELGPEGVLREVIDSKLMGRGGAAFPTGRKWDAVARAAARPHYLVCNADESEPGTFKDRVLMEEDPFAVVEAMTLAGYATGCAQGYLYVRGEYPLAAARLAGAIGSARTRGLLGPSVMGESFAFDIELRRGAGAYICGEETALFNSIEGFRGEPRNKPPFPVQAGLFGKPTAINNVETLANVLEIVLRGGPAFAAIGTPGSAGTKLFCLSGCVERPGVYEVPFGATLRQLIDLAGGVPGRRSIQAVLLGGAAGSFVTAGELDLPLTFEGARAASVSIGSGVIMVFDDGVDLQGTVLRIAAFFRDESCGQCVPCRVGTERQEEALTRLAAGRPLGSLADEAVLIDEVAQAMRDASICGLGQTAAGVVQSAITKLGLFGLGGKDQNTMGGPPGDKL